MKYATLLAGLVLAPPLWAHHSDAGLDMDSILAFDGTVTEFAFRNPHVYVGVETAHSGAPVQWTLQMGTANNLRRRGWTPATLRPGDGVTVRVMQPWTGGPTRSWNRSRNKAGSGSLRYPLRRRCRPARPASPACGGRTCPSSSPTRRLRRFLSRQPQADRARRRRAGTYDPLSTENPESTCIGRPTPAAIASTRFYRLGFELGENPDDPIIIRSEYFDEARTIHMDGRPHPPADQRFATGHSVGRWEGDTLVVDTTNFTDHRSPYQIGVPSGPRKHVIERYRLIENGTRMLAGFTLEDPDYIAEPMTHERELIHSPENQILRFNCDAEATRRFVRP